MIAALVGLAWLDAAVSASATDDAPWRNGVVLTLIVALTSVLGGREASRLLRAVQQPPAVVWGTVVGLGFVILPWAAACAPGSPSAHVFSTAWMVVALGGAFVAVMLRRRVEGAGAAVAATLLLTLYPGFFLSFVVHLRMDGGSAWLVLYFLFVCKSCDIGAYFTGLAAGRHKLIPWLSPKKTVEGFLGGAAASALVAVALTTVGGLTGDPHLRLPDAEWAVVFGALIGMIGQVGDLTASLLKRDAAAKDSGAVVPSFGGVLDVIDSTLLTAPLAWWLLTGPLSA
jgi:phosphatidate cytidylyltransferase